MKIGLIGHSISQSQSPALHRMLGEIYGFNIQYDLIEPDSNSAVDFEKTILRMRELGYVASNVTFPFKQIAMQFIDKPDEAVKLVGASNTIYLEADHIRATNTDFTGFVRAYRSRCGDQPAGDVLMLGAGGVGRAVAFGLTRLGAGKIYIYDLSVAGAESLAAALVATGADAEVVSVDEIPDVARNVDGLVNCTPIGHQKTPGNPLDPAFFGGQKWAFDAVYVPMDTEFLSCAKAAGLVLVSGFDLFFYQGIDAFQFFVCQNVDPVAAKSRFIDAFKVSSQLLELR